MPNNQEPQQGPNERLGIDRELLLRAGRLYESMVPVAELSSKATFSLLSSFALIGLCLASAKPQSVQVLGFTIQADHWLALAVPLALVVVYAVVLLLLSWKVESGRFRFVVAPLYLDLASALQPLVDEGVHAEERAYIETEGALHSQRETAEGAMARCHEELDKLKVRSKELDALRNASLEDLEAGKIDEANYLSVSEKVRQERQLINDRDAEIRSKVLAVVQESHEANERISELHKDGCNERSNQRRPHKEIVGAMNQAMRLNKIMRGIGLFIPLAVATFSIALLLSMALDASS